jgi:hypothetical protein
MPASVRLCAGVFERVRSTASICDYAGMRDVFVASLVLVAALLAGSPAISIAAFSGPARE